MLHLDRAAMPRKGSVQVADVKRVGRVFTGVVARTHGEGDGLEYYKPKRRTEYRDLTELRAMVDRLPGTLIIVTHPSPDNGKGGALTGEEQTVGRVLRAWIEGNEAVAEFELDDVGLGAVEGGLEELSLGYGVSRLDARGYQRGVNIDHLALVQYARCGAACAIRRDCADGIPSVSSKVHACACAHADVMPNPLSQGHPPMKNKSPNQNPAPADHSDALRSLEAQRAAEATARAEAETNLAESVLRADTAEGRIIELENQIKELRTTIAAGAASVESEAVQREKLRADSAEAKVRQFDATYEGRIRQRVALERRAWVVMGDDMRMDDLSDRDIEETVVKHLDANADVSKGVPDGVIHGRFLALTERHGSTARSLARVAEIQATQANPDQARQDAREAKAKRWTNPLPNSRLAKRA